MTEAASSANWMKDWEALSRQYWGSWKELTQQTMSSSLPDSAGVPWHEGLEQWSRMFGHSERQSETFDRLMASAKGYVSLMQSMIGAATSGSAGKGSAAWTEVLRKSFNMPGADASLFNNPVAQALRELGGQGAKGFEQMMAELAPMMAPFASETKTLFNMPAFGYLREHQEHYQKVAANLVDHQEHLNRYNALILKVSQRSFDIFQDKLAAREEPGRQIDSVRALYDLWVDAAEEAYAEIALSDEFRTVYGNVVNAQMRVRSQMQQEVERMAGDFGMPTRSEINCMGQRLQELRRELKRQGEQQPVDVSAELAALRKEVALLKAQITDKPVKKNAALRVTARKAVKTSKSTKR